MPHVIIPKFFCKAGKGEVVVKDLLPPLLKYTDSEKANFTYFFFTKEDDPDTLLGIEEYNTKADLYDVHMKSDAIGALVEAIKTQDLLSKPLDINDYAPVLGFMTRPGSHTLAKGKFVWVAELTVESSKVREEILNSSQVRDLVEHVEKNESSTLAYLFLKSLSDETKLTVFEIYENRDALFSIHHKSKEFLTFGKWVSEFVKDKESTGYTSIGEGWLARGGQGQRVG